MSTTEQLREELADLQHQQWSGWMEYMLGKCLQSAEGNTEDVVIPAAYAHNLVRLMQTPYSELTEQEKESDRIEADKYLALIQRENRAFAVGELEKLKKYKLNFRGADVERTGDNVIQSVPILYIDQAIAALYKGEK